MPGSVDPYIDHQINSGPKMNPMSIESRFSGLKNCAKVILPSLNSGFLFTVQLDERSLLTNKIGLKPNDGSCLGRSAQSQHALDSTHYVHMYKYILYMYLQWGELNYIASKE